MTVQVYFVRMDSAVTGETLAASHFLAADVAGARELAREQFGKRLTAADCGDMSEAMKARILELDAQSGRNMAAGVKFHVRRSNVDPRNAYRSN